ncbi:MAG: YARHG domain-containing protein [Flavobacteriales bacterium]|nr:YARHG domain-containing protein [Flavobacteriales bacterium]
MKKKSILLSLLALTMMACGGQGEEKSESAESTEVTTEASESSGEGQSMDLDLVENIVNKGGATAEDQILIESMLEDLSAASSDEMSKEMLGHWIGDFGKNMINLTITKIDGNKVEGYSVCAGNFRKIEGTVDLTKKMPTFVMKEPGTNQYDGTFEFRYDTEGQINMVGHWTPFVAKGNSEKDFSLTKKTYKYDPNVGMYPQASQKELDPEFLSEFDQWSLGYMRNEIYARHGYSFKNKDWRYEFEGANWYIPMGVDIRHKLTDIEIKNIGMIYEYESYYDDYYDEYGR